MRASIKRLLARLGDRAARDTIDDLGARLAKCQASLEVVRHERDQLAEVVARDRARVQAETAIHAREAARA